MRKDILNAIQEFKEVRNLINKSEIARRFNCSINTVNKYLNKQEDKEIKREYTSKLDNFKGIIIEKVDDYSANGRAVYNFIKEEGEHLYSLMIEDQAKYDETGDFPKYEVKVNLETYDVLSIEKIEHKNINEIFNDINKVPVVEENN